MSLDKNNIFSKDIIILCGFMGSGKSTISKLLATKLNYKHFELDELLEKRNDMRIAEVFKIKGEEYFRKIEEEYISELIDEIKNKNIKKCILSLGGGNFINPKNAKNLNSLGTVIWLDRNYDDLYTTICSDDSRPIAKKNTKEEIFKIYQDRKINYEKYSDYYIENNFGIDSCIEKILQIMNI